MRWTITSNVTINGIKYHPGDVIDVSRETLRAIDA